MGGVIRERGDPLYKPHHIFVLDPLEITALGLKVRKQMNGDQRWEKMVRAKRHHPDADKTVCIAYGAIIYSALFPDRVAADMRPPEDWKREAGIDEAGLHEARQILADINPEWEAKMNVRREVNEQMDEATLKNGIQ